MLKILHLRGYRSLLDFRLSLSRLTVITGENGAGKSNVYRSLAMLQWLAEGRFAEAIAAEGGMPSLVWSGKRLQNEPVRVKWSLEHERFLYEMECGLVPLAPGAPTAFRTDPDVKREELSLVPLQASGGSKSNKVHLVARRKGPMVELRSFESGWEKSPLPLHTPESLISEVRDANHHPGPALARETLLSWRFYHQFRTDSESPLRRPLTGAWSPVLAHDGSNLAATLQTIMESGRGHLLEEAVQTAFPDLQWRPVDDQGRFQLQICRGSLKRWLDAHELSDGTLRYFCLCAALLGPKPPPLLVLNEPETSLHAELMPAVAQLIAQVPEETQIIVVTHSQALASAIEERCSPCRRLDLVNAHGETRRAGDEGANRVWVFEENEE